MDRFDDANIIGQEVILIGRGTHNTDEKNAWMRDGTFMCFRKLAQDVAKWNAFVRNPLKGRTDVDAAKVASLDIDPQMIGARMVGRWPSGMLTCFPSALRSCTASR